MDMSQQVEVRSGDYATLLAKEDWKNDLTTALFAGYTYSEVESYLESKNVTKEWSSFGPPAFCRLIYKGSWGSIWSMSFFYSLNALYVRDEILPLFGPHDYVLIAFWGELPAPQVLNEILRHSKRRENFIFLCNGPEDTKVLRAAGLQAFTVSHNAFINRDHFRPLYEKKTYDAAILGSLRPQKRYSLTRGVLNRTYIITHESDDNELTKWAAAVIRGPANINAELNKAQCGFALSASEGGCYASTEMLYAGLVVVSTESLGGRDAYYTDENSIIVDDTVDSVTEGLNKCISMNADPARIREQALKISDQMIATLVNSVLRPIFERYNASEAKHVHAFVQNLMDNGVLDSKGRTVFQPESPSHQTPEEILAVLQSR